MEKHISLAMKAAIIAIAVAAYFVSVSGQDADDTKFCHCGPATKDAKKFPARLGNVLDDVVRLTSSQPQNPVSLDILFTVLDPANGRSGAAAATGTCFSGALANCTECLSKAAGFLRPCGAFACGGVEFVDKCLLQYRQIK